jgi:hypothetical protein
MGLDLKGFAYSPAALMPEHLFVFVRLFGETLAIIERT